MNNPSIGFSPFTGSCPRHGASPALRIELQQIVRTWRGHTSLDGYYCGACFAELIAGNCAKVGSLEAPERETADE